MKNFNNPFVALKCKNFKLYWCGMNISLIGTWMQNIAQPWLALMITNDPFLVSIVAALQFAPSIFLTLFVGAFVDNHNKKSILIFTQIFLSLIALSYTISFYTGVINYEIILVLSILTGVANAIDAPCRQSLIYELIDDQKFLTNAIALNSMSFNVARIAGPATAGLIMAISGVGLCFLINFVSYFAILCSLKFIKIYQTKKQNTQNIFAQIKDGIIYISKNQILKIELAILFCIATFIPNFNITISAFSKFVLQGGESTFGYLMSFLGVGSFFGAFAIALTSKNSPSFKLTKFMPFASAIFLICSGFFPNFWLCAMFLMLCGFSFVMTTASINSLLQLNSDKNYRGRVMSVYVLIFQGTTPLGAIFAGYFCRNYGASFGLYASGVAIILFMAIGKFIYILANK